MSVNNDIVVLNECCISALLWCTGNTFVMFHKRTAGANCAWHCKTFMGNVEGNSGEQLQYGATQIQPQMQLSHSSNASTALAVCNCSCARIQSLCTVADF